MDEFVRANQKLWDSLTPVHAKSDFYDMEAFLAGKCTLEKIDLEELGDVSGKSLLHLQCHFGQDTLSWARRGAKVTGADFSEEAISLAQSLAQKINIDAHFVCCNIYDLPKRLTGQFDIVYTSGGVLTWLPELKEWGRVVAHFVKPGGRFYIREFHPIEYVFADDDQAVTPRVHYPYFRTDQPLKFENQGSYADRNADITTVNYEWPHSMGEIINSLIESGLSIDYLHEFPFSSYQSHPFMKKRDDGYWHYPEKPDSIPFMFSIMASRR